MTFLGVVGTLPDWLVIWSPRIATAIFLFAFGASVGSFLNVVVYRLPAGRSVVSPPSRCPRCGWRLTWRENLPIVGWLLLLGRCRRCRGRISIQYPLVELLMGGLFATVYFVLFWPPRGSWVAEIGGDWWTLSRFGTAWPAYGVMVALLSALVAATVVDARTFLIPAGITTAMTIAAFAGWGLQAILSSPSTDVTSFPLPLASWSVIWIALGAAGGTLIACFLLRTGRIRRSFADYEDFVPEGDVLAEYPHGRREMGVEVLFLLPILFGGLLGWGIHTLLQSDGTPPHLLEVLGASVFGWFIGGGLVWAIRILGTLAFGREAMGMGDVHLLAGIGAALGWIDPIRIFFLAPFIALAWIAVTRFVATLRGRSTRELPYGPHLAAATVLVMVARPFVDELQRMLLQPPN